MDDVQKRIFVDVARAGISQGYRTPMEWLSVYTESVAKDDSEKDSAVDAFVTLLRSCGKTKEDSEFLANASKSQVISRFIP